MIERTYEGLTLDECMGGSDTLQGMDVGTLWNVIGALAERMEELEAVAEAAAKYYHTSEALDVTECDCADCDEARYELGQEKLRTALVLDAAFLAAGYLEKKT